MYLHQINIFLYSRQKNCPPVSVTISGTQPIIRRYVNYNNLFEFNTNTLSIIYIYKNVYLDSGRILSIREINLLVNACV